jgi:hypothetical protein
VGFIVSRTGWTVEYVYSLSLARLRWISGELSYQKAVEDYQAASHTVALQLALAHLGGDRKQRSVKDFLGEAPRHEDYVREESLMAENKTVTLGNGESYLMRPLNLNMMAAVEEKFGQPFLKLLAENRMSVVRHLLFLMLKEDKPTLTEERVGQLVTIDILGTVSEEIAKQVA